MKKHINQKSKEFVKQAKPLSIHDILLYEIHSHWFAGKIKNTFLQELMGKYFAWKVRRKYNRYLRSMLMKDMVYNQSIN